MISYNRLILVIVLSLNICFIETQRRYDNCVTWNDDLNTLTITCRVATFSQPVTLSHEKSGTIINCSITKENHSCYPTGKNITVDRHNHTMSIHLIEIKNETQLQGRWQCTQGGTKLFTDVSFSEGLISDSWVHMRGDIEHLNDGQIVILVECSSCRKPEAGYVEFLVNDRSHGSMLQNKRDNVCTYKREKCTPLICNCSSTGNMFSLRLPLNNSTKSIACEMHFNDSLRKGKYETTGRIEIIGEDVIYDESITDVIVKNKFLDNIKTEYKTVERKSTELDEDLLTFTFTGVLFDDSRKINLECGTNGLFDNCKVEFLVNGKTRDYFHRSGYSCYHMHGLCDPNVCHCDECVSFRWNHTIKRDDPPVSTLLSCYGILLRFGILYRASITLLIDPNDSSVTLRRKDIISIGAPFGTTTGRERITQLPSSDFIIKIIGINSACLVALVLVLCCVLYFKMKYNAKKSSSSESNEIDIQVLSKECGFENTQSNKASEGDQMQNQRKRWSDSFYINTSSA